MLGKFILEQRKKHNLTQDFLASKIGVSRPTYIQIEQGERDLTITEAKILSDIFGIVFDDFVQGKDTAAKVEIKKSIKKRSDILASSNVIIRIQFPAIFAIISP